MSRNKIRFLDIVQVATNLDDLVDEFEAGTLTEVVITRQGRPSARLLPILRSGLSEASGPS